MNRLHDEQIDVPDVLVRELIDSQFPQWAGLRLRALDSDGTVNRVDLLGDDLVVRIPIVVWGERDIERDVELLSSLAGVLPVAVPTLVGRGAVTDTMPWEWGVYTRLPGRHPVLGDPADEDALLPGLIETIQALRTLAPMGEASPAGFNAAADDAATRPRVAAIGSRALAAAWDDAVEAPMYDGPGAFIHGDLMPGNLLLTDVHSGARLTGLLDWAAAGIGDPALDLLPAWSCLTPRTRTRFLDALGATDNEIARARGYGARKVAWGLLYYRDSLPGFAAQLKFILEQLGD